ncbi:TRAP transporter solute receptor, TAXI family [Thermanaerovibrio velox DSM 12556]|uniref:TRAP transporter solute receptor, TAXI family n=1 Tax=Thermanaerovibrio velox DSM 12556 TaxID=926567 RepID=H0UR90_9BACT|nr:TAXI family TRAP transporter solute-binding subunit [Thermanaerovibrio velox]EHM09846.1 TRAP transporter solute receptor, TAXI family [Thermanaerovibrio velox DSM 12556]
MKRLSKLVLAAFLVAAMGGAAHAKTFLSIATGGTSGTYYPIGGAIAQAVNKGAPDLQVTAETGNASVANLNLIGAHDIEIAFAQNDATYWAYNGKMMFKTPIKNVRVIAALYPEHVHLITLKNSNVKGILDLKGKRVSVGAPGSGVEADVRAIFQTVGLKYSDMKTDFLDFGATTQRFKDNQIDAGFVVAGYPVSSIMDLATTKDITLVNFDDATMAKLTKEFPYFVKSTIPANTYKGVTQATQTPAVMALLVVDEKVPEDVVYKFTKALWENIDVVHKAHAKGKEINLKSALNGVTVPLHPGAAKYYKEKGLKLP